MEKQTNVDLTRNRSRLFKKIYRFRFYYLMALPGLAFLLIFHYIPMVGIIMAFKSFSPIEGFMGIITGDWVGLENFRKFVDSHYFTRVFGNSFIISFYRLIYGFPAPIILALLLNEVSNRHFKKTVQSISYFPHFISYVVILGIVRKFVNLDGGYINMIIEELGGQPIMFMSDTRFFRSILVSTGIWNGIGWSSIVYLAAITNTSPELYDAAYVDGANRMQQMWHITLPSVMNVAVIMLVLRMGQIMNAGFEQILLFYSPAVYSVSDIIDTFSYRTGILDMQYGYATAIGLFKSVLGLVFVLSANIFANKMGREGIW